MGGGYFRMPRDFDYTGFMKNRTKWSALFLGGFVAGCAGSFTPGATDGGLTDGAASLDGTTGDGSSPVDGSIVYGYLSCRYSELPRRNKRPTGQC